MEDDMSDTGYDFPITIHCKYCRGTNVTRDSVSRWRVETQTWEVTTVFDNADCDDCGGESRLVERKLDGSPVSEWDRFDGEDGV
jgi:hypothetical protein